MILLLLFAILESKNISACKGVIFSEEYPNEHAKLQKKIYTRA